MVTATAPMATPHAGTVKVLLGAPYPLDASYDGTDDNRSCNYGHEGETDDPAICDVRLRQVRNFLTTLLLSQGVPMILAGDDWQKGYIQALQIFLNGEWGYVDRRGEPVKDDDFLVLINASQEDVFFKPFFTEADRPWQIVLNTSTRIENGAAGEKQAHGLEVKAAGLSIVLMSRPRK